MKVLISNDDGYRARGIVTLARELSEMAEITVVAPERNRSGASNSLTLDNPIRATRIDGGYFVDGTPTDCVHLALTGLLGHEPDVVVAGVNAGANLGDDVIYSGTVAAAMEGRFLGLPALAISLVLDKGHQFETAARVARILLSKIAGSPIPTDTILNVNVPDIPFEGLAGIEVTRLGHRHKAEGVVRSKDPRGRTIYWVGPAGPEQDAGPGTDFHAIANHMVSVTPLQVDLTRHAALAATAEWAAALHLR
ncbi:MAG: 5'/3'-nucleotidase SurE [Acidimicrobiia bacterium]